MKTCDIIKMLRKNAGMTQTELAFLLNSKKQTISKYEVGIITNIPMDKITLMAKIFGVTPEYLLGFSRDKYGSTTELKKTEISPDEEILLQVYRKISQEDKKIAINILMNFEVIMKIFSVK